MLGLNALHRGTSALPVPPAEDATVRPARKGRLSRTLKADLKRAFVLSLIATLGVFIFPAIAAAQAVNIDLGTGAGLTDRVVQLIGLITVLSLAPSIVIMTTSFVRIVVVLSLLRTALGLQQSPPNSVLISLPLFLTAIVMAPTFQASYNAGIKPLLDHKMELPQAFNAASPAGEDLHAGQVDQDDLGLFVRLSQDAEAAARPDLPIQVVTPAFMISELKRAFEIGFLLFVPFLVIDLVVASVLMSMGMMMLPPVVVSLPFKLIFFVLVDGWRLVAGAWCRVSTARGDGVAGAVHGSTRPPPRSSPEPERAAEPIQGAAPCARFARTERRPQENYKHDRRASGGRLQLAAHQAGEVVHQRQRDVARLEAVLADLAHRRHLGGGAGDEALGEVGQLLGQDVPLDDLEARCAGQIDHRAAGDAVQEAVGRRRVDHAVATKNTLAPVASAT